MRGSYKIKLPAFIPQNAFHIVFFLNIDNKKKHLLRFGIIELSVLKFPHFAKPFSISRNLKKTLSIK